MSHEAGDRRFEANVLLGFLHGIPSWLTSTVFHMVVLLLLALWTIREERDDGRMEITSIECPTVDEFDDPPRPRKFTPADSESTPRCFRDVPTAEPSIPDFIGGLEPTFEPSTDAPVIDVIGIPKIEGISKQFGSSAGTEIDLRKGDKKPFIHGVGGTNESEAAVAAALKWITEHQRQDGSWSFDHREGKCAGRCSQPGKLANGHFGATGLALLPLLGAGQTHREGTYKENVGRGLRFLVASMKADRGQGSSLADEGTMYSHGICAIALCEAYAMTHDRELFSPAQAAIRHIGYAQDPVGGGWRYQPRTPGDTSVVGWQLMALKSGHFSYLAAPSPVIQRASNFLDSVQSDSGSRYGYTAPGSGQATTAVGLLCRMYLGWKKDHPALERGVDFLAKSGPSKTNLYYDYYATQVMHHFGGQPWVNWNEKMRDWLVETQDKEGHQKGSWMVVGGDHGADRGGRMYCTSLATMILEVYYRHMPLYRNQATAEDFPL